MERFRKKEDQEFQSKVLGLSRVARMTAGGRRFHFRAVVVVGDGKGRVGLGVAKGKDTAKSIAKAMRLARKELLTVPMRENTIPHQVMGKFGAAEVLLKPQRKGRGLVAGGVVRVICQLAGIRDISSKMLGQTRNKLNNAKATLRALSKLKVKHAAPSSTHTT